MTTETVCLQCLGVGPGWPCPERGASAFLYRLGETTILCDCGEPAAHRLKAAGVPLESVDHLLLTHLHSDHVGGLFLFLQGCWVEGRRRPLAIHLPAHGIPAIREMLRQGFIFDALLPFSVEWRPWEPGHATALADWRATPVATTHLDRLLARFPNEMPAGSLAVALALEGGGRRIVHSGDLGAPEDLAPLLPEDRPTDLLVAELGHFPPEAMFDFLQARPVRQAIFVHLALEYWPRREEIAATARRRLPGMKIAIPEDGARFEF